MLQISKLLTEEERVKNISARFSKGDFNVFNKDITRRVKDVTVIKEATISNQKQQKEKGSCFNLNLPQNLTVMSNDILRSGLFSSARRAEALDKTYVHDKPIATIGNTKISLTGYVLDQVDYEVYECLIKQFKIGGVEVEMTLIELIKLMGWDKGGNQTESLIMSLKKLNTSTININTPKYWYSGGLVDRAVYEISSGTVNVKLGAEVAKMYASDNWTMLDLEESSSLGRNYLARWLYKFYQSHKSPYGYKLETIKSLSNNEHIENKAFNLKLKKSCALMNEKLGWEFRIENKKLYVTKKELAKEGEGV